MKYTYNLSDFVISAKVEKLNWDLKLSGQSISVEFSAEELTVVGQNTLAMKNAATEAFAKCLPILKDAIVEIGQTASYEILNHRKFEHSLKMERIEQERAQEKEKQDNWRERNTLKV